RARIVSVDVSTTSAILDDGFGAPDDTLIGFKCRVGDVEYEITSWDTGRSSVTFAAMPTALKPGVIASLFTGEPAPILGARIITGTPAGRELPPLDLRLATTRATNALLEEQTAPTALFLTAGFRDLLRIGDQRRANLFALKHEPRALPYTVSVQIDERTAADGTILTPLDEQQLRHAAASAREKGISAAAVSFMHSDRFPAHERRARTILREAGFEFVSASSEINPSIRYLPRATTAAVNASLSPIVERFLDEVRAPLTSPDLLMMTSAGGLEKTNTFQPKDSLLSGPAGGVVGTAAAARSAGIERFIAFDMGGTSTDVSRYDGDYTYQFEQRIGRAHLLARALKIETVAAGGGSICSVHAGCLSVGPESAGAHPGPACYGAGGPLTITDVNLLLGRIDLDRVGIPLNPDASEARLQELMKEMDDGGMEVPGREDLLQGLLDIAVERMAEAIRRISAREGYDPSAYSLVAFGGAGPQHACAIARRLHMRRILIPSDAGLLSALGLQCSGLERIASRQFLTNLEDLPAAEFPALERDLLEALSQEAPAGAKPYVARRLANLRLKGQDSTLTVDFQNPDELPSAFFDSFLRTFGYAPPANRSVELVDIHLVARTPGKELKTEEFDVKGTEEPDTFIASNPFSTVCVEPGWTLRHGNRGAILLEQSAAHPSVSGTSRPPEIVAELYRHRLQSIVGEMGALLQRTAVSTNVKERQDYSCAILDPEGRLVVNAPHIPVHLGAMGLCVREVDARLSLRPGDIAITNHPACGGSHLPDVTVVSAVFDEAGERIAYVANRAHHAEIGGIAPGSMPANAKSLAEEGVLISPMLLYRAGEADFGLIENVLQNAPYPTRSLADNLADLRAQCAALLRAKASLESMEPAMVRSAFHQILSISAREVSGHFARSPLGPTTSTGQLDDGSVIQVQLRQSAEMVTIDFSGTTPPLHPGNLNATPAIVQSAILYVLRLLVREEIPLNEGLMDKIELNLPPCFLHPQFGDDPALSPAVVGGNVETSQRLVSTLIRALGLQAESQGTMNNLIFGNESFGFYETIAGGAGAGDGYEGADGIHTHMTNTAITDPEIIETRYPVRLREFEIRTGSGGPGKWRGGDGLRRTFEFLAPLEVSLLTQNRTRGARGSAGGGDGLPGRQSLLRADGTRSSLPSIGSLRVSAGDRLCLETPGGGGWGAPG
ncbi:MAG: hydantoinase B/oxoprolinase family protein, partial [Verrucomicrobiota bacterium]